MKECNQCGKCCVKYANGGLSATSEEVRWWETFRPEISRYVRDGKIWTDPVTDELLATCPWLRKLPGQSKYMCAIYNDRPNDCKHYPVDIAQMVDDGCEMLELRDLTDQDAAQRRLDQIMANSRPPAG